MRKATRRVEPWVERLAWLMDNSIPLGGWRIGLDGLAGLIPGVGDYAGTVMGSLIVGAAAFSGISKGAVARMLLNLLIDASIGAIPLAGDIFDFTFKANARNIQIFQQALNGERSPRRDWAFVAATIAALAAIVALPLLLLAWLFRFFFPHGMTLS